MFGSRILEVAIGVICVFLLVSIICTAVREGLDGWLKTRAAFLELGIRDLLHDPDAIGIARAFYDHPLINGLYGGTFRPRSATEHASALARGHGLPSYIPARNFAIAIMDIAARGSTLAPVDASAPVLSLATVRANVINLENAAVQRLLLTAIDISQGDFDTAVANIAAYYDSAMDRVSGAYKRATQKLLFFIGLAVAVALNVNPITIADYLYHDDATRAAVVARAEVIARDSSLINSDSTNRYAHARAALDSLHIPIGWDAVDFSLPGTRTDTIVDAHGASHVVTAYRSWWNYLFVPLLGWIITAFAATLGAPFWFDILNKVMVIRSTVKPHEKSPEESSDDRQTGADRKKSQPNDVAGRATGDSALNASSTSNAGSATTTSSTSNASSTTQTSPAPIATAASTTERADDVVDGCDAEVGGGVPITSDEQLPAALGGVAP